MANAQLLVDKYKNSGKTKTHLSKKLGVSRPRLDSIFNDPETATVGQGEVFKAEFGLTEEEVKEIFLP